MAVVLGREIYRQRAEVDAPVEEAVAV
jgi:hypothetical protein